MSNANKRSGPRGEREVARLRHQLDRYRTGQIDAGSLAQFLLDLERRAETDLPWDARDLLHKTAQKLNKGAYRVRGAKLTGNLLHLERIVSHFWGTVQPPTLVGVGSIWGGVPAEYPEARALIDEFRRMTREVSLSPGQEDLRITFVFLVPGQLDAPDFEGVRTSSFFRSERAKQIQVAVPSGLDSSHMKRWLAGTLVEAIDLIRRRVKRRYAPLSTEAAEQAIAELASKLASGSPQDGR